MFKKILIANRGEVALRIQRACRELGIENVVIFSQADAEAKYVRLADEAICIGPASVSSSYLNSAAIIAAAEITDCKAIHPGYGLLSENANFARQLERSGFTFIGPNSDLIDKLGDKVAARQIMKDFDLNIIGGTDGAIETNEQLLQAAKKVGYPVMIKAAAGGGGRGMGVIHTEAALLNTVTVLRNEIRNSFGDDRIYLEKYLSKSRHIELQIISDKHGNSLYLGARDCSIQRRHQKLIEEAPPQDISPKLLQNTGDRCALVARKLGYSGLATFEFLYDDHDLYFIEVNTRLQVEHPVTEMTTGIDLVIEQIKIAANEHLQLKQRDIQCKGHAIELRINAENPDTFMPSPGKIDRFHQPGGFGVRFDTHAYQDYEVSPYYDSLIGKLICHSETRKQTINKLRNALNETIIEGIETNIPFHRKVLTHSDFTTSAVYTDLLTQPEFKNSNSK